MATTVTQLAASVDASTTDFYVASSAGAGAGNFIRVDSEFAVVVSVSGNKVSVRSRGDLGGSAMRHDVGAPVTFGENRDLMGLGQLEEVPTPTQTEDILSIGQNAIIGVPQRHTTYLITKATALGTSTLGNPSPTQDGLEVGFISLTDAAHVVTLTTSSDGTTGNTTTYTFPAFKGAGFKVKAFKGAWVLLYASGVTPT